MLHVFKRIKSSLFKTILISYLLMLLIGLAIGIINYNTYSGVIRNQNENYNRTILQQTQLVIDERLRSIERTAMKIEADPNVRSLLNIGKTMNGTDRYKVYQVNQLLMNSVGNDNLVDNMYIYLKNPDLIISNNSVYRTEDFYLQNYRYSAWDLDQWRYKISGKYFMEYHPEQSVTAGNENLDVISVMLSLPLGLNDGSAGTLVISINSQGIKDLLRDVNILNNGSVLLFDGSRKMILSAGNTELLSAVDNYSLFTDVNDKILRLNNTDIMVSQIRSNASKWYYISLAPEKIYMKEVDKIKNITLSVVVSAMLVGIILAFVLAKKSINPIKEIAVKLRQSMGYDNYEGNAKNELDFICIAATKVINDNSRLRNDMVRRMPEIRSNIILQILKGNILQDEDINQQLASIGVYFKYDFFIVIVLNISEFVDNSLQERNLIKFAAGNVIEYSLNDRYGTFVVDSDMDQVAVIVNLPEADSRYEEEIKTVCSEMIGFIKENFSSVTTAAIGGIYKGYENIVKSYMQALQALEYQLLKANGEVIFYRDPISYNNTYSYSIETEMQLINCIKLGNFVKVNEILDKVYKNFENSNLPLEVVRCLFFDITGTAFKVLSSLGIEFEDLMEDNLNPYERIISCKNADEMQNQLKALYKKICDMLKEREKCRNSALIGNIVHHIKNYFNDSEISLVSVADAFEINPNYLSGYFKEQTGENFLTYINNLRLNETKRLLTETSLSLCDIAKQVGYSNNNVLIRNFKKYEGMTPGDYRQRSPV